MVLLSNDRFFFFQAEDGIRDLTVTGVQTCALPIVVARAMSSNASRYCRSESSALTAFSRRSHAAALGRRMPWRSPMVTGVEDHVSTACGPLTVSRASDEVTNSAPPVTGSVWDRLRLRAAFVWSWGRNRVLPSGCSTGMIDRL